MKKTSKVIWIPLILVIALSIFAFTSSADEGDVLLDISTEWRYLDNNTDPAKGSSSLTSWTLPSFDDSDWKRASGKFGAKNGAIGGIESFGKPTVLLEHYSDNGDTIPTYFFRTTFTVNNVSSIGALAFDILADDAIVVYINGKLVSDSRSKIPSEASNTNLYYASHASTDESFMMNRIAVADALVEGENVIAVELHNNNSTSSDIYFAFNSITVCSAAATFTFDDVVLTVGADETSRNITWHSVSDVPGTVEYAPVLETVNGQFPETAASAVSRVSVATNKLGYAYSHKAVLKGLLPNTDYAYRLTNEGVTSKTYYFSTDPLGDYEFVFVGDPQISSPSHSTSWIDTLTKIKEKIGADLLISAGDQISNPTSEDQYGYLLVDKLTGLTFAPTIGPGHDSDSVAFTEHFALPNVSTEYGVTATGANYWYTYNGTLFMHLNMSDTSAATNGEHEAFMKETINLNPNSKWKIVIIHNALYSAGDHSNPDYKYYQSEIGKYRAALAPVLTDLGIDIVLSGHDHIYVRSHIMNGDTPKEYEIGHGYISEPDGTLHIAASSSTGSKFYSNQVPDAYYAALINDEARKSAIHFSVTDTSISFKSYFLDDMTVFDSLTIYKTPHVHNPESVDANAPTCDKKGNEQYWQCTGCKICFIDEACTTVTTHDAMAIEPLGHKYSDATCSSAATCQREGCGETDGKPKEHSWLEPTCTEPAVCKNCGKTAGKPKEHSWREPTCTEPAVCKICSATDGDPLGHKYANSCATACSRCDQARETGKHTDNDRNYVCDACGTELEKGSAPIVLVIVISASALVVIAAVAAVVIVKKKKS